MFKSDINWWYNIHFFLAGPQLFLILKYTGAHSIQWICVGHPGCSCIEYKI